MQTFKNRGTDIAEFQYVFNADFGNNSDLQQMWKAFLEKRKIEFEKDFSKVIEKLELFLLPCIDKGNTTLIWNFTAFNWENTN